MDPSRTGSESGRPKLKLFSMSQSRALLESQRLNTPTVNYSQNSSNLNQDRGPPQNPRRISLASFLTQPSRIATSTPPRNTYDTAKEQGDENSKISNFVSICCLSLRKLSQVDLLRFSSLLCLPNAHIFHQFDHFRLQNSRCLLKLLSSLQSRGLLVQNC